MERLPVELLDSVFEFLSGDPEVTDNALRQTRLVCRSFCNALTSSAFKRVRLCEFNRDAFDCLVSLSQSPLASYVRTFEYKVVHHLSLRRLNNPPETWGRGSVANDGSVDIHKADYYLALEDPHHEDPHHDSVEHQTKRLMARHQVYLAEADVLGTFYDVASLVKAMPGFRSLREVVISRFDDRSPKWYPTKSASRAIWGIVKALQYCDYQIKSLTIDAWDLVAVDENTASPVSLAQMARVARGLTSLTATKVPQERNYREPILRWLLFNSTGLERLCMSVKDASSIENHLLHNEHGRLFFKNLVDLELRTLRYLAGAIAATAQPRLLGLSRFLKLHKKTLRRLSLSNLQQHSRQWSTLFGDLKDELQLSCVQLESLSDHQGSLVHWESSMREWEK
jgi:hypothetical protein